MAIKEWVDKKSSRQREQLAIGVVLTLALVALLWGVKVYCLPHYRTDQSTEQGAKFRLDQEVTSPASIFNCPPLTTIAAQ